MKFLLKFLIKFKWIISLPFSLENIRTDLTEFQTKFRDDTSRMLWWCTFTPTFRFYLPWKRQTTKDFLTFLGDFRGYKNETVEWNGLVSAKSQYFENILFLSDINLMFRCLVSIFWLFIYCTLIGLFSIKIWYANLFLENWKCKWYGTVLWSHLCKFSFFLK